MATRRVHFVLLGGLVALQAGCSWKRFADLEENTPVASLEKPAGMDNGFGVRLATASIDDQVELYVTGSPGSTGAASFRLGMQDDPSLEAADTGHCTGEDDVCYLAEQVATLPRGPAMGEELRLCLVAGLGVRFAADGTETLGLLTRCQSDADNVQFAFPLPGGRIEDRARELIAAEIGDPLVLAADADTQPLLAAVWPQEHHAWFYLPGTDEPTVLDTPAAMDDDTPTAAALLRSGDARILAVGAADAGHVWLFRIEADGTSAAIGCLGGPDGLGRALASGPVVEQGTDDLVAADAENVHVLSGAALAALPPTEDPTCSLAALPAAALVTSFGCGQTPSVDGCEKSSFGAAVAVGDVDGDADGEVIVGAPFMTVRGEKSAGAVLLYDVEGAHPYDLTEVKFFSSAKSGDQLGMSLATPRIEGRQVIAAGAPGGGKTVLFYCNELLPSSLGGARCD